MKLPLQILLKLTILSALFSLARVSAQSVPSAQSVQSVQSIPSAQSLQSVQSIPNEPITQNTQSAVSAGGQNSPNSYCVPDSTAESTNIRVRRALVDPKEASDSYGRRLGRRFIVFEVTVENKSPSLQYLIHDVSVDLSRLNNEPSGTYWWAFSSQDLIMLRGVPEKGADYDPRNLTLHIMQGTGAVAGGVTGLTSTGIQDLYGGVAAAFNGPVLSAFGGIFPDHTATQLNRLSDSAFTANTVVAKQSAKTFAIFVPEGLFMSHSQQKDYWKEPTSVFSTKGLDFRQADVCVDGAFISEIPAITLASVAYDNPAAVKAGASVKIDLTGTNFSTSDTLVDLSIGGTQSTVSLSSASSDGRTASADVSLPSSWTAETAVTVGVESKSTGQKVAPLPLTFSAQKNLGITAAALADPASAKPNAQVTVNVTGQGMVAGDTQLIFNNGTPVDVTGITDGSTGQAKVTLPVNYDSKSPYSVMLKSKKSGATTASVNLVATQ